MKISIFGLGYVGCVSLGCLAQNGHKLIGVDTNESKVSQINAGEATIVEKEIDVIIKEQHSLGRIEATTDFNYAILETELSIIAVGTPSTKQGHLNLQYIFKVAENFGEVLVTKNSFHVIAIRSTVMPGTCEKFASIIEAISGKKNNVDFAVISNPEFLREGSAVKDYYNPPLTLIGSNSEKATFLAKSIYKDLPAEIIVTDVRVAEIMKYVNNTFHALKISFANEIGNICSALDIDSHKVMDIFCKDKQLNISPYYLKPGFAYGGSCLPKDLKGLQTLSHDLYLQTPVINSIDKTNDYQIQRAIALMMKYHGKKIALLGISFKAGTDDLRNSPAVEIAEVLIGKGFDLRIYDKNVQFAKLTGKNKEYIETRIPHLSNLMVKEIESVTAWADVIILSNNDIEIIPLLEHLKRKVIVDFVRLPLELDESVEYIGINW